MRIAILLLSCLAYGSIYKKGIGTTVSGRHIGATINLDFTKSYLSAHINLSKKKELIERNSEMETKEEIFFYLDQMYKSLIPKYFLFEVDYFPLTALGAHVKSNYPEKYEDFDVYNDGEINIIDLVASRYEKPYSYSIFLGDIIPFFEVSDEKKRQTGSSVMGHVFTIGRKSTRRILLVTDHWFQYTYKIKGSNITKDYKRKWSFDLGFINHTSPLFYDAIVLSLTRDYASRTDDSFWKNIKIEYVSHFPHNNREGLDGVRKWTTFQKIVFGRNFPFKSFILGIDFGIKWEAFKISPTQSSSDTFFILAPNVSW